MEHEEQKRHMINFLKQLNKDANNPYILKGGTALMVAYGLPRFSEDIDLDARNGCRHNLFTDIKKYCNANNLTYRTAKDIETVQRAFIYYNEDEKPLKVEASYRRKDISDSLTNVINGIKVYNIDELAKLKSFAFIGRDKIRDLYDLSYICNNFNLSDEALNSISRAFEYKGMEQFDYIIATQSDPLINSDELLDMFLAAYDKLGLITDENEIDEEDIENDLEEETPEDMLNDVPTYEDDDWCL